MLFTILCNRLTNADRDSILRKVNMSKMDNKEALLNAFKNGATIVTPNNRLSNQFLHDFFIETQSELKASCDKLKCLSYTAFLRHLYDRARHEYPKKAHPIVLNSLQQRYMWEQILTEDNRSYHDGLLHEIQEAWTRCQYWNIDKEEPLFTQTPQTFLFQQWWHRLQHRLDEMHAITEEQFATYLITLPQLYQSDIIWACFDDYTPQQQQLQNTLQAAGCNQYHYDLAPHAASTSYHYAAKDTQDEYLQIIQWLKARLAAGDTRIAVVVPDLQTKSEQLHRLLQQHIPSTEFDVSLGYPLYHYPLVAQAMRFLQLDTKTISNQLARILLHSPYLGGAKSEFIERSEAMQNSHVLKEASFLLKEFVQEIHIKSPKLSNLLQNLSAYPQQASPAAWIEHFKTRLKCLGFPGEYSLHSANYQCFQRFMSLLEELLSLSLVSPLMSKTQAISALKNLCKFTIFQPKKNPTPIQILGLLEASGCTFDSVWVSGLTDQCLPQKTNLSAFIPLPLQRDKLMPHANVARELQFAKQLVQRLGNGCRDSVFSYPRLTGDTPNLACPLICHLPALLTAEISPPLLTSQLIPYNETYILPFAPDEVIKGGTTLLANQAKCPFRAFAAHRLYATPSPAVSDGPDASERGQLLHRMMELFWRDVGSQHQLLALTPQSLYDKIDEAIRKATIPLIQQRKQSFPPLLQEMELERLHRLVQTFIEWEKQRPPFVVEAIEQNFDFQLSGIDIRVRIDRLDRMETDAKWVIDYKSSLPINKPWNEERPEAPQLLFYALLDDSINALLFIQLKSGRIACSGLSEEVMKIQGISSLKKDEKWSNRKQQWHQQLTLLADEIKIGHCPPQPHRSSTCQRCEFSSLCRMNLS